MKNKVTRACTRDCQWLQTNWPKLMYSTDLEFHSQEWRGSIRNHLATCVQCREEIGSYFLPELWEAEPKLGDPKDSSLAGPVLERLGINRASENPSRTQPVPSNHFKALKSRSFFPGIQPTLINFGATAVIILTLTCTGYFNLLPQLENGVKTLSHQVEQLLTRLRPMELRNLELFGPGWNAL